MAEGMATKAQRGKRRVKLRLPACDWEKHEKEKNLERPSTFAKATADKAAPGKIGPFEH